MGPGSPGRSDQGQAVPTQGQAGLSYWGDLGLNYDYNVVSGIQIQLAWRSESNCLLFRFDESIFKMSMGSANKFESSWQAANSI